MKVIRYIWVYFIRMCPCSYSVPEYHVRLRCIWKWCSPPRYYLGITRIILDMSSETTGENVPIHFRSLWSSPVECTVRSVLTSLSALLRISSLVEVKCYRLGRVLQLRAHSCSVRQCDTTYLQLLHTQGHVFSYSDAPLWWYGQRHYFFDIKWRY
jgi:hypothetical protein